MRRGRRSAVEVCGAKAEAKGIRPDVEVPGRLARAASTRRCWSRPSSTSSTTPSSTAPRAARSASALARDGEVVIERRRPGLPASGASTCRGSSSASTASTRRAAATLGGTGLGLAIVKHIAQAHGGRVSVESAVGAAAPSASTSLEAERADPAAHGRLRPASLWPIRGPHAGLTFLSSPANRECAD